MTSLRLKDWGSALTISKTRLELGLCLNPGFSRANNGIADAHRDGCETFRCPRGRKMTAFLGLEIGDSHLQRIDLTRWRDFSNSALHADLESGEDISPPGSSPFGSRNQQNQSWRGKKEET